MRWTGSRPSNNYHGFYRIDTLDAQNLPGKKSGTWGTLTASPSILSSYRKGEIEMPSRREVVIDRAGVCSLGLPLCLFPTNPLIQPNS